MQLCNEFQKKIHKLHKQYNIINIYLLQNNEYYQIFFVNDKYIYMN